MNGIDNFNSRLNQMLLMGNVLGWRPQRNKICYLWNRDYNFWYSESPWFLLHSFKKLLGILTIVNNKKVENCDNLGFLEVFGTVSKTA